MYTHRLFPFRSRGDFIRRKESLRGELVGLGVRRNRRRRGLARAIVGLTRSRSGRPRGSHSGDSARRRHRASLHSVGTRRPSLSHRSPDPGSDRSRRVGRSPRQPRRSGSGSPSRPRLRFSRDRPRFRLRLRRSPRRPFPHRRFGSTGSGAGAFGSIELRSPARRATTAKNASANRR